ncbi:hypothetical protein [Bradyrhizobium ottawaense]|uniref:hypothetical protein n=1 Tax=Bradyrhizobium ottawaense TaxID=931866 RepID=UPI001FE08E02|nr:hypothetical protein [Bradyrhizobium ottawaense]
MLQKTIEEHNGHAAQGRDPLFKRGESAFNRTLGDPTVGKNPNLGPIKDGPFIALPIVPATLGDRIGDGLTEASWMHKATQSRVFMLAGTT